MFESNILIAFLSLLAVLILLEESYADPTTDSQKSVDKFKKRRIINGKPIPISQAPWIVQIKSRDRDLFVCAGTLVSPRHVISAAHCYHVFIARLLKAVVAEEHLKRSPNIEYRNDKIKSRNVSAIYRHPDYVENTSNHADVALVVVESPFTTGRNTKIIPMCNTPVQAGNNIDVMGWGHTDVDAKQYSNQLMKITIPVMSMDECKAIYRNTTHPITDSMFCSAIYKRKDACHGDSGGPAVHNNQLCGVVSWSIGCASDNYPGVYTSIPVVRDFIDTCMTGECIDEDVLDDK